MDHRRLANRVVILWVNSFINFRAVFIGQQAFFRSTIVHRPVVFLPIVHRPIFLLAICLTVQFSCVQLIFLPIFSFVMYFVAYFQKFRGFFEILVHTLKPINAKPELHSSVLHFYFCFIFSFRFFTIFLFLLIYK